MSKLEKQSRFERDDDVVVMKFGGTSVEDSAAIFRLITIVRSRLGHRPVIVVSALARVTDQLLEAGRAAAAGRLGSALETVRGIYVRHEQLADSLIEDSTYGVLDRDLRNDFRALEELLQHLHASRQLDPASQDRLLSFGERFAGKLVNAALQGANVPSRHVDARDCIVTDASHGQANPDWEVTNQRLRETLSPVLQARIIPVLGGFIASTVDDVPTTLGRGGSDLTATIVGAALGAIRVEIWTDVDGVMTADPKLCPDARLIRKMSFSDADELARNGAKVLHPATLGPAMRENIPVHVLNSRRMECEGTEIVSRASGRTGVCGIAVKQNVAAVEIEFAQEIEPAQLGEIYSSFHRRLCRIDVMAASQRHMSIVASAPEALPEISADLSPVASLRWENHKALVCLVGEEVGRKPELINQIVDAMAEVKMRVVGQGTSDRSISLLVEESAVEEAVQRLHGAFFSKIAAVADWGSASAAFCQAG